MKKALLSLSFLFILSSAGWSNVFIDAAATYVNADYAKGQIGGNYGLGFSILPDWNVLLNVSMTFYQNLNEEGLDPDFYSHDMYSLGIEYTHPILNRLHAFGSIFISMMRTTLAELDQSNELAKIEDMGLGIMFLAGAKFDLNQWFSPFISLGYHSASYADSLEEKSIQGFVFRIGARFIIWGNNKSIETGY